MTENHPLPMFYHEARLARIYDGPDELHEMVVADSGDVRGRARFNPISIASHFRDAGATPAEEAAYPLSDGIAYVEACLARGFPIDAFAPRLSWFFHTYVNFFEEIAKYRGGRRLWASGCAGCGRTGTRGRCGRRWRSSGVRPRGPRT